MPYRLAPLLLALAACTDDHHTVAVPVTTAGMAPTIAAGETAHYDPHHREAERGDVIVLRDPCALDTEVIGRVVAIQGEEVEVRCDELYVDGDLSESDLANEHDGSYARYHDELGGQPFDTFHDPGLPARKRAREALPPEQVTYEAFRDPHDFPADGVTTPPGCAADKGTIEVKTIVGTGCAKRAHLVVPEGAVFVLGDNRDDTVDSRTIGVIPLDLVDGEVVSHAR